MGEGRRYEPTAVARQVDTSRDATTPGPDGPVLADRMKEAVPLARFFFNSMKLLISILRKQIWFYLACRRFVFKFIRIYAGLML